MACLRPRDFKSLVSTNFTIRASGSVERQGYGKARRGFQGRREGRRLRISGLLRNASEPVRVEPFDYAQDRLRGAESKHERLPNQWLRRFDSVAHTTTPFALILRLRALRALRSGRTEVSGVSHGVEGSARTVFFNSLLN